MSEKKTSWLWWLIPTVVVIAAGTALGVSIGEESNLMMRLTYGSALGFLAVGVGAALWMQKDIGRMQRERRKLERELEQLNE